MWLMEIGTPSLLAGLKTSFLKFVRQKRQQAVMALFLVGFS